jgi:hypothetical protein
MDFFRKHAWGLTPPLYEDVVMHILSHMSNCYCLRCREWVGYDGVVRGIFHPHGSLCFYCYHKALSPC